MDSFYGYDVETNEYCGYDTTGYFIDESSYDNESDVNPSYERYACYSDEDSARASLMSDRFLSQAVSRTKVLSCEDEQKLGKIIINGGKAAEYARNKLIESNLRLVYKVANKYKGSGVKIEDLVSMGIIGLVNACDKFSFERGNKFSTYAVPCINNAIVNGIFKEEKLVRIPNFIRAQMKVIKQAVYDIQVERESTENVNIDDIARFTGMDVNQIRETMNIMETMDEIGSLDVTLNEDSEDTIGDFVQQNGPSLDDIIIDREKKRYLEKALEKLSDSEYKVVCYRFGLFGNPEMTLREIGELPEINLSRERIRQIELKGKKILSKSLGRQKRYL